MGGQCNMDPLVLLPRLLLRPLRLWRWQGGRLVNTSEAAAEHLVT